MAGNIFGPSLDRNVNIILKRFEEQWSPPGIVQQYERLVGVSDGDDGRDILDLKGQRARGFGKHDPGVGAHDLRDACPEAWIIVGCLYPKRLRTVRQKSRVGP